MSLEPGTTLGPYEILSLLGEGGMGSVYKARDPRLGRFVAIKVAQKNFSERFEREAHVIALLNHPHICTLYDVGPNYLVMEFVDGKQVQGPIPAADALKWARQIALALDHAHKRGVTHRDLKPANIMVTANGVKVLDFGLARLEEEPLAPIGPDAPTLRMALTVRGTVLGTPQYMPPEQVEGRVADARSDVWSFACVLYEMLVGKRAFEGNTVATTMGMVLASEPASILTLLPDVPPVVDRVLRRCFKKDPEERYQAAKDILWDLDDVGVIAAAAPLRKRRQWLMVAGASIAALALGVGAATFLQPGKPPTAAVEFELPPPEGGRWGQGAISPDGRTFAGAATAAGKTMIYTRPLDRSIYRPLAGTEGALDLAWSPDSRNLAFKVSGKLKRIALDSGIVQEVCSMESGATGLSWGSANTILFSSPGQPLQRVAAAGGSPTAVFDSKVVKSDALQISPYFFPDGKRFLFYHAPQGKAGIYAASLDGGAPKLIFEHNSSPATFSPAGQGGKPHLLFSRNEQLIAQEFDGGKNTLVGEAVVIAQPSAVARDSVSAQGTIAYSPTSGSSVRNLRWRSRAGADGGDIGESGRFQGIALSPDGQYLAYSLSTGSSAADIWIRDLKRGASSRLTFESGFEANPVWSPDGARVAYYSFQGASRKVMVRPANGTNQETLLFDGGHSPLAWSPDGRWMIATSFGKISLLSLEQGSKAVPFSNAQFQEFGPRLSPDGRWIAYSSNQSGRPEIYVRPVPKEFGGPEGINGKWQVSTAGGSQPYWNQNGKELFFLSDAKMMSATVEAGKSGFRVDVPKMLFESKPGATYVVAPDGRFLMSEPAANVANSPMHVILNWESRIPKK
ncbi:MAG: serine/threonine-protein kinase [Candidatus Solibacter usitatus]|nr:serine/threonine-protein kinase [Candidatus Solibacter usitatus]